MSITHPKAAYRVNDSPTVPGGIWIVPEFTCEMPFGTGYFQREMSDCLRAALATITQIPYERIPATGRRPIKDELSRFAMEFCFTLSYVDSLAKGPSDTLWLALSDRAACIEGDIHTYVALGSEIVFDPWDFRRPGGEFAVPDYNLQLRPTHGFVLRPEGSI